MELDKNISNTNNKFSNVCDRCKQQLTGEFSPYHSFCSFMEAVEIKIKKNKLNLQLNLQEGLTSSSMP